MPERVFATETWDSDEWFQDLSRDQRYLFIYLWTNNHCNPAGLYHITLTTIANEAKFSREELPSLLKSLAPKVQWYPELTLIWVKNFLRRQAKSSKFIIAALKSLNSSRVTEEITDAFETYNENLIRGLAPSEHVSPTKRECVLIRDDFHCQYCGKEIETADDYEMDHIIPGGKDNYLNLVASCRSCNQKKLDRTPQEAGLKMPTPTPFHGAQAVYILRNNPKVRERWLKVFPDRYRVVESILTNIDQYCSGIRPVRVGASVPDTVPDTVSGPDSDKGVGEEVVKGKQIPRSRLEAEETLYEGDQEIISVWCSVKGFDMAPADASALVASLRTEFPDVDILAESKTWAARKLTEPLEKGSRPSQQIWNWMRKAREFAQERRDREQGKGQRAKVRPREAFRGGKW